MHNSISVLSQDQIDDLSPFAPPRWIPAYAGMTLVVQRSQQGRGDATPPPCIPLSRRYADPVVISPCQEEGQWVRERGGTGWFVLGLRWAFWADGWLLRRWLESG